MLPNIDDLLLMPDLDIVSAMLGAIDDTIGVLSARMVRHYSKQDIVLAYRHLIISLPDYNIETEEFDHLITHLDILWDAIENIGAAKEAEAI